MTEHRQSLVSDTVTFRHTEHGQHWTAGTHISHRSISNSLSTHAHTAFHTVMVAREAFSALTLLAGWQEGQPACKKLEWWGTGMVICLERGADLHMAQLMPLPLTVSCFSKIQIGFAFLVPAHPGSPGKRAIKRVCVCV